MPPHLGYIVPCYQFVRSLSLVNEVETILLSRSSLKLKEANLTEAGKACILLPYETTRNRS